MEKGKENEIITDIDSKKMVKNKITKKTVKKSKEKESVLELENSISFAGLEGKFLLVKVGDKDDPATTEQIGAVQDNLIELFKKNNINCAAFVTHHLVTMDIIGRI